jgi:hypothetical protein
VNTVENSLLGIFLSILATIVTLYCIVMFVGSFANAFPNNVGCNSPKRNIEKVVYTRLFCQD